MTTAPIQYLGYTMRVSMLYNGCNKHLPVCKDIKQMHPLVPLLCVVRLFSLGYL